MPDLSGNPAASKMVFQAWKNLPRNKQNILRRIMQSPCAWCQEEFELPPVGKSHGICRRHQVKQYTDMGMKVPPEKEGGSSVYDMAILEPQERTLLKFLYSIIHRKHAAKSSQKPSTP